MIIRPTLSCSHWLEFVYTLCQNVFFCNIVTENVIFLCFGYLRMTKVAGHLFSSFSASITIECVGEFSFVLLLFSTRNRPIDRSVCKVHDV